MTLRDEIEVALLRCELPDAHTALVAADAVMPIVAAAVARARVEAWTEGWFENYRVNFEGHITAGNPYRVALGVAPPAGRWQIRDSGEGPYCAACGADVACADAVHDLQRIEPPEWSRNAEYTERAAALAQAKAYAWDQGYTEAGAYWEANRDAQDRPPNPYRQEVDRD